MIDKEVGQVGVVLVEHVERVLRLQDKACLDAHELLANSLMHL